MLKIKVYYIYLATDHKYTLGVGLQEAWYIYV